MRMYVFVQDINIADIRQYFIEFVYLCAIRKTLIPQLIP